MNPKIHPAALFRLSVLGPLASRGDITYGELTAIIKELSKKSYDIPHVNRVRLSEQTIRRWYYAWQKKGIEGLNPSPHWKKGQSYLKESVQEALLSAKQDNPRRSINTLIHLLESQGVVAKKTLSRASVHRFLQKRSLSKQIPQQGHTIERRAFVAEHAGQLWHGDVLHGPSIQTPMGMRKTYLVSLLDDASRLIAHSAFCLGETALDIEGVLKQALLKRGVPYKMIIDNGPAYRSKSLQTICASLEIRLIYCRPYEPEGKGKLERYHRTFRALFLDELNLDTIKGLEDLNARLWAWTELVYHQRVHEGLGKDLTPLARWREDLIHVRPLGLRATQIEDLFYHRYGRTVRKDATVRWEGKIFEVPYKLASTKLILVVDPHEKKALRVESQAGEFLGTVTPLDPIANNTRKRHRPSEEATKKPSNTQSTVEYAYNTYCQNFVIPSTTIKG